MQDVVGRDEQVGGEVVKRVKQVEEDSACLQQICAQHNVSKAVKADKMVVPVYLWNDRICQGVASAGQAQALAQKKFMQI
jgi:hypothetical protein